MRCDFVAGDKVVCVNTDAPAGYPNWTWCRRIKMPVIGEIYTIDFAEGSSVDLRKIDGWEVAVGLVELPWHCSCNNQRGCFPHGWFRKVEKKKSLEELFDKAPEAFTRNPEKVDA